MVNFIYFPILIIQKIFEIGLTIYLKISNKLYVKMSFVARFAVCILIYIYMCVYAYIASFDFFNVKNIIQTRVEFK